MSGWDRTHTAPRRGAGAIAPRRTAARRRGRNAWIRRLPRPGPRLLAALVVVVVLAGGGWLWLRHSSLVAVRQVTITGVSGPDAGQIHSALDAAAREMTTMDVKLSALRTAVAPFPVVKRLNVSTSFPHGMRIQVIEQVPVAEISAGDRLTAVSADGTLLHDAAVTGPLPTISLAVPPGGTRVQGATLTEIDLLAAAPYPVLARIAQVSAGSSHGLVAQLRNGPAVYFGTDSQLAAKWSAVVAVLASSSSSGASYIDVTDPLRPAAGPGSDTASSAASGTGSAATGSATTGVAGTTGATGSGGTTSVATTAPSGG